jgi:hypothetical protein
MHDRANTHKRETLTRMKEFHRWRLSSRCSKDSNEGLAHVHTGEGRCSIPCNAAGLHSSPSSSPEHQQSACDHDAVQHTLLLRPPASHKRAHAKSLGETIGPTPSQPHIPTKTSSSAIAKPWAQNCSFSLPVVECFANCLEVRLAGGAHWIGRPMRCKMHGRACVRRFSC